MKHVEAWVMVMITPGPGLADETVRDSAGTRCFGPGCLDPWCTGGGNTAWYIPNKWGVTLDSLANKPSNQRSTTPHTPHARGSTAPNTQVSSAPYTLEATTPLSL